MGTERVLMEIAAERGRQVFKLGFDSAHDDQHTEGEMANAAACYALLNRGVHSIFPWWWPWDHKWWKPKDRRRDLIRAAALLVAEIERLDRKEAADASRSPG